MNTNPKQTFEWRQRSDLFTLVIAGCFFTFAAYLIFQTIIAPVIALIALLIIWFLDKRVKLHLLENKIEISKRFDRYETTYDKLKLVKVHHLVFTRPRGFPPYQFEFRFNLEKWSRRKMKIGLDDAKESAEMINFLASKNIFIDIRSMEFYVRLKNEGMNESPYVNVIRY